MEIIPYLCSVNTPRNSNKLSILYELDGDDNIVVKVRYGERERDAEASWISVSASMDRLLVPMSERITYLRQEYNQAPTENLYTEYLDALTRFSEKLQAFEENQRSTTDTESGVSIQQPLTIAAKKVSLHGHKTMQLREHFTPVAEVSSQVAKVTLDNLVEHQYISPESRSALAQAFGWTTAAGTQGRTQRPSADMVIWQRNVYILRYMILTLLGKEETELDHEVMSCGRLTVLPVGTYGRRPILAPPTASDRHWQVVASWFIDRKGRTINADSLRSTRYPSSPVERANFKEELLSCFAPILLAPPNRKLILPPTPESSLASQRKLVLQGSAAFQD